MAKKKSNTKKTFHVRIVPENEDLEHTIYSVSFSQKQGTFLIRTQSLIEEGDTKGLLLGLSVNGLFNWQKNDPYETDSYNEIYDPETKEWRRCMTREELLEMHLFGGEDVI